MALARVLLFLFMFLMETSHKCEGEHSNLYFTKVEVQNCFTGSMRCTRKLVVALEAWQGFATGAEDVTVVIDSAKDATTAKGETIYFQNPFGLTIHKPEPLIKYKLSSRLLVPFALSEYCELVECLYDDYSKCKKRHFFDVFRYCTGDILLDTKICTRERSTTRGCCSCTYKPQNEFAGPRCAPLMDCNIRYRFCTMHAVSHSDDKYLAMELSSPELIFDISLMIDVNGNPQASFTFDKKNREGLTRDFSIHIKTSSSLYQYDIKLNFDDYLIALPCLEHVCSTFSLDRTRWLLLKKSEFTFNGVGCDKIGVSKDYFVSWFVGDTNHCFEPRGSCLRNDIKRKIEEQDAYRKKYHKWLYSVEKFGRPFSVLGLPSPSECQCIYIPLQTAEMLSINIEFNIDKIKFLKKRSLGIIEAVRITPPPKTKDAKKKDTIVSITILNIGSTQTMFQVTMECDIALPISKRARKTINPQDEGVIPLYMILPTSSNFEFTCYVTLLDAEHNQLDQRMLWMSTFADQYASKYVVGMQPIPNTLIGDNHEIGNLYWSLIKICKGIAVAISKVLKTITIHS